MKTRQLGANGFEVSEVGLGCWQLGSDWGSGLRRDIALEILETAAQQGVSFFDTADVYGQGRSEDLIGQFLRHHDGAPIRVATKFGRGAGVYPDGYTEDALRRGVDASRERLGVEALDLLQLHCIPTDVLRDGVIFDWLRKLQDDGAIRHFGASVETVEEGLLCLEQNGLQSLQVIFNLFRQKLSSELLPQAAARGVGIIVRLPLASGVLSGKFRVDSQFAEGDHRSFNRDGAAFNVGETFAGIPFETAVALADRLKPMLPEGVTLAGLAQRWILDHPAVSTIIPGASAPDQVMRNVSVSDLAPLPEPMRVDLAAFYEAEVKEHIRGPY
ncbi:aryl-alcohol dehydrogenase-like predicted oxidoreductase [Aliiruegeria haliotis]|uniref:Aryl-alcohol dehydrogenase-like predicted oxidoreductase n=1 Tax=Aliiruegeria haliotis TaxID=1280846 RepID=A0A2T0RY17_9RHOB|nr:aldo/keto reductase [Aliiruegeria haliotis]PRY26075.1 aryl-alcohol dehydrogenase-like predicted oxidoreductase [Aliiruegeria haliotis]